MSTTPAELEAHIQKQLELEAEAAALLARLNDGDYRTKTEKRWLSDSLAAKRQEIRDHIEAAPAV